MKERLEELRETVRQAYDLTDQVPASGAGLDRLAGARQGMREAYRLAGELLREPEAPGPNEGGAKNGR